MFERQIDRDIKGVVKVGQDDEANIHQELEEYVVTDELQKHIGHFLQPTRKALRSRLIKLAFGFPVFWIGKSHFLKYYPI